MRLFSTRLAERKLDFSGLATRKIIQLAEIFMASLKSNFGHLKISSRAGLYPANDLVGMNQLVLGHTRKLKIK